MKVNVAQKRTDHRALRCPARWRPSLHLFNNLLLQKRFYQLKHPPIAHLFLHPLQKPPVWNGVEVASQISIHYKGVASSEQPLYFPKRILATKPRAKTITHLKKLLLKDRLQHKLKRRLHNTVFNHGNPQRTKPPASFGNLHPSHGLWPVASTLKSCTQFLKIDLRSCRKPLHALPIHSCCPGVRLNFLPCRLKRLGSVHFVDQAEPFTSFDAVFQRRQHALIPHRSFHPRPVPTASLCALRSPRHYRRLAFALLHCEAHASTFLPPVPQRSFAFCASRGFDRFGTLKARTPAPLTTHSAGLPAYLTTSSCRSVPNHVGCLDIACPPRQRVQRVSDFAMNEQARRSSPPNRVRSPTDQQFALGCSPRRFGPTQLPSATELWHTPTRTSTVLMWRPHRRTHSRMLLSGIQTGPPTKTFGGDNFGINSAKCFLKLPGDTCKVGSHGQPRGIGPRKT